MTEPPPATLRDIRARLADIAPLPDPDTADPAAMARYLAVEAVRHRVRHPGTPSLAFAALHALRTADFACGNPCYATPARAVHAAREIAAALRGEDDADWLCRHLTALGLEPGQITLLAEAEMALCGHQAGGGGSASAAEGDETPGPTDAAIRGDERARIRSLVGYNVSCCEGFPAAVADLIGEHGDSAPADGPGTAETELARLRNGAATLGRVVTSNARAMEAARIEMLQNGPEAAMQWILNALPDQRDGEPGSEWNGTESASEWFDRTDKAS